MGVSVLPDSLTLLQRGRALGANDRIRIGIIGCGNRGCEALMEGVYKHVEAMNFEIVAVSDPWRVSRERANLMVIMWFGRDAVQYVSYRDLLEKGKVDAVMIASPDHLHTLHLEASAKAGMHIYVEKPLAMEMDKLVRAVLDGITNVLIPDDSQVVRITAGKCYGDCDRSPGLHLTIRRLD